MEHLIPDGEGNWVNLRHVAALVVWPIGSDGLACADEEAEGYRAVAIMVDTGPLPLNSQKLLPTRTAASAHIQELLRIRQPWPGEDTEFPGKIT